MTTEAGANFFHDLENSTTVQIALSDENKLAVLAKCTGAPPSTANVFQHGCLILRTDSGTGNSALYENKGSSAVPSWDIVGAIAAGEITLAEGNVLVGANTGLATALNAKTNAQILIGNGTTITSAAVTGDIGITNAGLTSITAGVIVNADVNAAAAIDYSKLAALASGNVLVGSAGNVATSVAMSGDVTISNGGVTAIGAAKVLSAMLNEKTIQYVEFALSKANILAMNGAPVSVLAAPAAGKVIEFVSAVMIYDFDTAAYGGGGDVTINYTGGSALSSAVSAANSFGAAGDKVTGCVALDTANGIPLLSATGLSITNDTGAFTDPGTAAGVGRIKVAYRVHTTGL